MKLKTIILAFIITILGCEKENLCEDIPEFRIVNDWKYDVQIHIETLNDDQVFDVNEWNDTDKWHDWEWTTHTNPYKIKQDDYIDIFVEDATTCKIHFKALIDTSCVTHEGPCIIPGINHFIVSDDCETKEYYLDDPDLWKVIYYIYE